MSELFRGGPVNGFCDALPAYFPGPRSGRDYLLCFQFFFSLFFFEPKDARIGHCWNSWKNLSDDDIKLYSSVKKMENFSQKPCKIEFYEKFLVPLLYTSYSPVKNQKFRPERLKN